MAEEIKDISLSNKKSFRLDGDNNRIIYLDTSDMNLLVRLEETYPEIRKLAVEAVERLASTAVSKDIPEDEESGADSDVEAEVPEDDTEPKTPRLSKLSMTLKDIDAIMREKLNYIFASDIADTCEPTGNMYDLVGGEFRFEHIIEVLTKLYANNITAEYKKMQERVKKHTAKYTKKRRK